MSTEWTDEKHHLARQSSVDFIIHPGGDVCERVADYLDDALDEIERLWSLLDDPAAVERGAEAIHLLWHNRPWGTVGEFDRADIRMEARVALRAALNPEGGERTEGEQRMNAPQRFSEGSLN